MLQQATGATICGALLASGFNETKSSGLKKMDRNESSSIPGMIEPIEQETLFQIANELSFDEGDSVVEFGTFLGRSTNCIAQGLFTNKSYGSSNAFYAYDSFECSTSGGFSSHVYDFCRRGNVTELLKIDNDRLNFYHVFLHYVNRYIDLGIVKPVRAELIESYPLSNNISLIHIDSPKFYEDFKVILFRFFPRVKVGGIIIFQDFFYHWSASLIAICGLLFELGYLEIIKSSASSLICKLNREISDQSALEIDLAMSQSANISMLIDSAKSASSKSQLDRPDVFHPRLTLAKFQWLFEHGKHNQAAEELIRFFAQGGKINKHLLNDFIDLLKQGVSIRKLYEIDHNL